MAADGFMPDDLRRGHFDRAVAHFNARRFWHAHEDWEEIWHEAVDPQKRWLQALIQYAAALFHFKRGFHASGFSRLLETATEKAAGYAGPTEGIDWDRLKADLAPWIEYGVLVAGGAAFPEAPAEIPVIAYEDGYEPAPLPLEIRDDRD